jgi:hypothetical protein
MHHHSCSCQLATLTQQKSPIPQWAFETREEVMSSRRVRYLSPTSKWHLLRKKVRMTQPWFLLRHQLLHTTKVWTILGRILVWFPGSQALVCFLFASLHLTGICSDDTVDQADTGVKVFLFSFHIHYFFLRNLCQRSWDSVWPSLVL